MKYQSEFTGTKTDFAEFIKKTIPDLFGGRLVVEGKTVSIPNDLDLDYKVKTAEDEAGGSVTIKVSWEIPGAEDEEVEVETD